MPETQGSGTGSGPSLFVSLRSFWSVLLAILYTRLDLCTTELQDQAVRGLKLVLAGAVAVLSFHCAFFFAMLWLIVALWNSGYVLWVIGGIFGVYLLIGIILLVIAQRLIASWPGILSQTISELRRDVEGLNRLARKTEDTP